MGGPELVTPNHREIAKASGISYPNIRPYTHITLTIVAWNEEVRLLPLLQLLRPVFSTIIVGVQNSYDMTETIAQKYADVVILDGHRGYGDATYPTIMKNVRTKWAFKIDADEVPDDKLLKSLSHATWMAERMGKAGVWIPFRSWIDGIEYEEQHNHLRLWEARFPWPGTQHSRPPIADGDSIIWNDGHIRHERTLNEMIQDYLRYYAIGKDNPGWEKHNREMMYHACSGTAKVRGWDYVFSFPWWPRVETIAFTEDRPWQL